MEFRREGETSVCIIAPEAFIVVFSPVDGFEFFKVGAALKDLAVG